MTGNPSITEREWSLRVKSKINSNVKVDIIALWEDNYPLAAVRIDKPGFATALAYKVEPNGSKGGIELVINGLALSR